MARAKVTQNTEAVSPDDLLGATLSAFEAFLSEMSTGALGATEDAETRHILTTSTTSVQSQFAKVTNFAREHHSKLNVAQREEVDVFLRVQDGIQMANSGAETARAAFKTGWFKKFLQWAIHGFKEIKKTIPI